MLKDKLHRVICLIPLIGAFFIIILNQLDWYARNILFYHIWFWSSLITIYTFVIIKYLN